MMKTRTYMYSSN